MILSLFKSLKLTVYVSVISPSVTDECPRLYLAMYADGIGYLSYCQCGNI